MYHPNAVASSSSSSSSSTQLYHAPPPLLHSQIQSHSLNLTQPHLYQPPTPTSAPSPHLNPPYIPRAVAMDNFGMPPSPSSQFSPDDPPPLPTSYVPAISSTVTSARPYMSPQLSGPFDSLSTHSPAMNNNHALPGHLGPSVESQYVSVHEWGPSEGAQGTSISIRCDVHLPSTSPAPNLNSSSPGASRPPSNKALRIVFGTHPVPTAVTPVSSSSQLNGGQPFQLSATVPSWSSTGAAQLGYGNKVNVFVEVLEENHSIISSVPLGEFSYVSAGPRGNPLKRGGEVLESSRPSPHSLHRRVISTNSVNFATPELQQYPTMPSNYNPSPTGRSVADSAGSWQSPYMAPSAVMPSAPPQPAPPPYTPGMQPSLMRSTQLGPSVPAPTSYVNSGQKACLELQGDLNGMSKQWSTEEWHARRRLVQFWRRQDGTTIHAAFAPLSQADYPANQQAIIISCIFREDKNACFVTSVDAIYLLEALVGTRFTVEEKNRIRRNLEGFRPITVSKSKPGSEDFFRLIMNFPNPRPRNIEKDVKVFPWEILGSALKKIIGKYSASFPQSSTMPPPPAPMAMQAPPHFSAPPSMPSMLPHPEEDYGSYSSSAPPSGSAPHLTHHSSADSATSFAQSSYSHPQTPQTHGSPSGYRTLTSNTPQIHGSEEKHYLNLSPPYGPGSHGGQWSNPNHDAVDGSGQNDSYVGVGLGYGDQPHQLPHLHQSMTRNPGSNDLRVMYPGMAS